jgi:hypothetical protein
MVGSPFFWLLFFGDAKKSHSARTYKSPESAQNFLKAEADTCKA